MLHGLLHAAAVHDASGQGRYSELEGEFINPLHPNIGVHILYTFPNTKTKLPTAQENAGH